MTSAVAKIHQIRSRALNLAHGGGVGSYSAAMHTFLRRCALLIGLTFAGAVIGAPIDRHALVTRHNPTITAIDKSAPFMVGNGNFAFTADITGLQTFQDQYSPLVPLLTEAQWGWHSFPEIRAQPGTRAVPRARQVALVSGADELGRGEKGKTSSGCARTRTSFRWDGWRCIW